MPHRKLRLEILHCGWCAQPLPRIRSHSLRYCKPECREAAEQFRRKADPLRREARAVYTKRWRDDKRWKEGP
jgi:hypothetical protein